MTTCSRCEECWHRECTDDPECNNIDTVRAKKARERWGMETCVFFLSQSGQNVVILYPFSLFFSLFFYFFLSLFAQWLCSSCSGPEAGSTGGDSDEDISGDDDSGGSGGDASGDEGSGSDNTKPAKTRASRSPHIDLVEAKRGEDREIIGANRDGQREIAKKKKEDRPIPDTRYLTRNDVIEAARAIKAKEEIDSVIMQKMEKEDPRLYGITTDPVSGTLVNLSGKKGRVVATRRDVYGYVEYRVGLEGKHRKTKGANKKFNTRQLLEAAEGKGVVRWKEEVKRVRKVFCAILCYVYCPLYKFVTNDPKVKRKVKPVDLKGEDGTEAVELRQFAWNEIKDAPATHVVNDHEIKLLASDEGLEQELGEKGTLARVLGTNLGAYSGLMCERKDYAKEHYINVDHYVKGAQAAYKLGRVMSFESCMAPLSVGGQH